MEHYHACIIFLSDKVKSSKRIRSLFSRKSKSSCPFKEIGEITGQILSTNWCTKISAGCTYWNFLLDENAVEILYPIGKSLAYIEVETNGETVLELFPNLKLILNKCIQAKNIDRDAAEVI